MNYCYSIAYLNANKHLQHIYITINVFICIFHNIGGYSEKLAK